MAVTVTNLIQGPGTLYSGAFGALEPADTALTTAPDGAVYTDTGGTMGGVQLGINQEYSELEVDQIVDIPGRRLTKRETTLSTNLAEPTLANLALVLNQGTITTGAGFKALEPVGDTAATQPTYKSLLFDGFGPDSKRRRIILRKTLNVDSVEFAYEKDGQTVFTANFAGHYVSSSVKPFRIIDEV